MIKIEWINLWSKEDLYNLQVNAVTKFMKCDTQPGVETAVEFAKLLDSEKLDSDNYPIFLEILREENYNVTRALLGKENAFDFFIFGILYRNYHRAKDGYVLYPLSIENLNSIGKYLDKSKKQEEGVNRFILDILSDIADYTSQFEEDEEINKVSSHAIEIRNAFFDKRLEMKDVMPQEILERKNYMETSINPRKTKPFLKKNK